MENMKLKWDTQGIQGKNYEMSHNLYTFCFYRIRVILWYNSHLQLSIIHFLDSEESNEIITNQFFHVTFFSLLMVEQLEMAHFFIDVCSQELSFQILVAISGRQQGVRYVRSESVSCNFTTLDFCPKFDI